MNRVLPMLLLIATPAFAADFKDQAKTIETRTLKNGMKVIVWPDQDIPNVALYNWFRVGSRNERPGITGLSHFFEHMMFNGSEDFKPGEFDRVMEANGGAQQRLHLQRRHRLPGLVPEDGAGADLRAGGGPDLLHLPSTPKVVESERGVVYSERRSGVDNDNRPALDEQVMATAFVAHPYQFPSSAGPRTSSVDACRPEQLLQDVLRAEQRHARRGRRRDARPGLRAGGEVPGADPRQPPPDRSGRRSRRSRASGGCWSASGPSSAAGGRLSHGRPPTRMPAVDLLVGILTDGESSRLHRSLVEESQAAIDVGAFQENGFDPSLASFFLDPSGRRRSGEDRTALHPRYHPGGE